MGGPLSRGRMGTGAAALDRRVVGTIALFPSTADALTWIALILVPIGGALALGWAMRGARPWLAALAAPLLAIAVTARSASASSPRSR